MKTRKKYKLPHDRNSTSRQYCVQKV